MAFVKTYSLSPYRSIVVGAILIIVGIAFTFIGFDTSNSVWRNLQFMFLSFEGVFEFIISFILLLFKVGFIVGGYFYIKYADRVVRAKIDDKGFYYQVIPSGSKYDKLSIDLNPLKYAPYTTIRDIEYRKTFWNGGQLDLTLYSGKITLTALGALKDSEKREIADTIKARISARK